MAETHQKTYLQVSSFNPRFCAAGRKFVRAPTFLKLSELTREEIDELECSPHLKTARVIDPNLKSRVIELQIKNDDGAKDPKDAKGAGDDK